ncbi:MAG: hypothetical protein QF463_05030 [Vicinamibacterales bacterium]|nr:hypothetical protein [Vicinamibacterales bacterium]
MDASPGAPAASAAPKPPRSEALEAADRSDATALALNRIGSLLLAAGFLATFVPGWMAYGFVAVWVGCGLGLKGSRVARWAGGLAIGLCLTLVGVTIGGLSGAPAAAEAPTLQPFLVVTVQSMERADAELVVRGTVLNTGNGPAYSPAVELTVFEDPGENVVADEIAYPQDIFIADLNPGQLAPFEVTADLPDDAGTIRWDVAQNDHPGEVVSQE